MSRGGLYKYFSVQENSHSAGLGANVSTSDRQASTHAEMIILSDSEVEVTAPCKRRRAQMAQDPDTESRLGAALHPSSALPIQEHVREDGRYKIPQILVDSMVVESHAAELLAMRCFQEGCATWQQIADIMNALPDVPKLRWAQEANQEMASPKSFMTGAWARGPHYGLTRNSKQFPRVSSLLAHILSGVDSSFMFSSCTLSRNVCSAPHRDSHNAMGSYNLVVPCSQFQGGEIWVQTPDGGTYLSPQGEPGTMWDASTPIRFDPRAQHATAPWGGDRLVLIGYHVRNVCKLSESDAAQLVQLGFGPDFKLA